jgi:hypothetical protein
MSLLLSVLRVSLGALEGKAKVQRGLAYKDDLIKGLPLASPTYIKLSAYGEECSVVGMRFEMSC